MAAGMTREGLGGVGSVMARAFMPRSSDGHNRSILDGNHVVGKVYDSGVTDRSSRALSSLVGGPSSGSQRAIAGVASVVDGLAWLGGGRIRGRRRRPHDSHPGISCLNLIGSTVGIRSVWRPLVGPLTGLADSRPNYLNPLDLRRTLESNATPIPSSDRRVGGTELDRGTPCLTPARNGGSKGPASCYL